MARRKQRRPQHLENERDLAHSLQNGIGSGSDSEDDEHVCGKCRAEFPSLSDFLQHKKQCVSKRPVLVNPPLDSSADTDDEDDERDDNCEPMSPQPADTRELLPSNNIFWSSLSPFLLLAQHRTDSNVTLEELKNTTVAVAQHSNIGEATLTDIMTKFRQSQVESLQLLKSLEHIMIMQNNLATAAAPPALVGTAALTPPQSADGPPLASSALSSSANLEAYPQGGRNEEESQVPLPENSLALLEKQTERYLQDSMSRRSFLLNGIDDDKSKKNKPDDPSMRHRCHFCGKLLGSDSALQIHLRSHTGEKPFSCNVCGSSFSTRGNLKVHFQRHRENDELLAAAAASADGQKKQQDTKNGERSENPPVLFPNDTNHRGDSSKGDQALDFSASVNGRKSPNDDNSCSVSPNDMSNFSDNSDGSSDENMTAENFSELKIDVERFDDDDDDRDNSNMDDDDESEMANSQTDFGTSPSFAKYFLPSSYVNFAVSSTKPSNSNANNNGTSNNEGPDSNFQDPTNYQDLLPKIGSNDNSWESLIEVTKPSETFKLQQMVDNIEYTLTEPNQCIMCHRVLSCKSALQMHYRTHTGERPFKCKLCSRAFTTKGNLKTHMGVHRTKPTARLMNQCPVCHKPFPNAVLLQQHIRNHTENPSLQLTPLFNSSDDRPPTLLPPSYPRQFLIPPQLVNPEPLALTYNKTQDSKNECTNESVIKATGLDSNISPQNPPSPALSSASSCSPCNIDENTSKDLQPPVLDLAQPEQDDLNEEKMDSSPSEIPKITECNSSPERENLHERSSPVENRNDFDANVKQEPPNLMQSPKSITSIQENENRSSPNISIKSPSKFSSGEHSMIVSLPSDRPLPMTLPSDCPLPFSMHNSDRPYPPMSMPDFTTASLTALENHVKGIASNVAHPLPFPPHFALGLNVHNFYREYSYPQKSSTSSPSTSKNGSEGSADDRSTPGTGISTSKRESPRSSMTGIQTSTPKSESNGMGALDLTPRSSPSFQRPAGTEMKIYAPLAGLPFGHNRLGTTCRICYKTFACQSALEIHYRSHTKERPFRCEVCERGFSTKGNMRQHMLTHKIRDLPAQVFSNNSNTQTNASTSTIPKAEAVEEKSPKKPPEEAIKRPPTDSPLPLPQPKRPPGQPKHLCQVCNKPFSSGSALQIHMRTHTGDKPFQCHICHRAFTTKGNLKVHMGTHMWNNSTSRRGRRMSLDISPLQITPGAKPGEFTQASYFPYLTPFINGLPPPQPPPKMNEISVIQTAGVSNGSIITVPPVTINSSAPSTPQQPLPLISSIRREEQLKRDNHSQNQNHLSQGNIVHAVIPPTPEISVSWPWKIACKICNKICSSSTELEMHVRNNHSKKDSPEAPNQADTVP